MSTWIYCLDIMEVFDLSVFSLYCLNLKSEVGTFCLGISSVIIWEILEHHPKQFREI